MMLKWQQVKVSIPYRVHAMSGIIGVYLSKNRNVSIPYRVHAIGCRFVNVRTEYLSQVSIPYRVHAIRRNR